MNNTETIWLRHRPPIRIGTKTGRVIAYDPAFDLCLVEWENGQRTSHEVGLFIPPVQTEIRAAAEKSVYAAPRPPENKAWLDFLALCLVGLLLAALFIAASQASGS